jgi:hypothetical protein
LGLVVSLADEQNHDPQGIAHVVVTFWWQRWDRDNRVGLGVYIVWVRVKLVGKRW